MSKALNWLSCGEISENERSTLTGMPSIIARLKLGFSMSAFPKEQVQKLTPEAQEALGHQLIERTRHRAQLLETAKRPGGETWWGKLPWVLSPFVFMLIFSSFRDQGAFSWPVLAGFAVLVGLLWVIDFANEVRAIRIDRRLDALIKLLEINGQLSEPGSDPGPARPKPATTAAQG